MKTLVLVRHAKSSWKYPELDDHDRPLNKRGQRDTPVMAARIAQQNLDLQRIVSSTANRALTFATAIADACTVTVTPQREIYTFSAQQLLAQIQQLPDDMQRLALVGHNPAITEVVNHLSGAEIVNVPTAAYVVLNSSATDWRTIQPSNSRLLLFDYPETLAIKLKSAITASK